MKRFFRKFRLLAALIPFACTADYDTFGTSDYRTLDGIELLEQDGSPVLYSDEHRLVFSLLPPPDSLGTWDSVTVEDIDISHFASLHLVESKFKVFPSDSASLDSLARSVVYEKKAIRKRSRLRIPASQNFYVVVLSESGESSIWQWSFKIPSVEPAMSSNGQVPASSSSVNPSGSSTGVVSSSSSAVTSGSSSGNVSTATAPKILSLRIAGMDASIDTVSNIVHLDTLPFLADLASLELSGIELSEGAFCDELELGAKLDLSSGIRVAVKNILGETENYEIRAGYQLPNSGLDTWNGNNPLPDSTWNNANTILTTTKKYTSGSTIGAEITTGNAVGKIASGSLYTAVFNPKGVGTLSMANSSTWPDGNELLDFGKPFRARPRFFEVKFQYKGQNNDSCDMYVLLENRTGDKNVNRTKDDVNKLVASAWYRSATSDNSGRPNPDVVEISSPDAQGFRTVRMKLQYGIPLAGSPIENSSTFTATLQSKDNRAINNGLLQGSGDEPVTHIRVVFASSAAGNRYVGVKDSKLIIDELRLVY